MKKEKQKEKRYYDVKVNCTIPAIMVFRVLAESPEEALELVDKHKEQPKSIKYEPIKRRNIKAKVCDSGTVVIKHVKNY